MVDNRGITPVSSFNFKSGDISGTAAKTSEEKYGQGTEYFANEMQEEQDEQNTQTFQDRSAQLRASLNGLAMANAGSIMLMKSLKDREKTKKPRLSDKQSEIEENEEEIFVEEYED